MKSVHFSLRTVPYVFAAVTILAYGIFLPLTGFYWDDWPFAWIAKFLGPAEFIPAFRGFRPFLGPIFFITSSLIPANPLLWQIFALVIRFLAVLSVWLALDQIWPHYKRQTIIASLLFLVFPGYSQHWVAFTHINQEWIPLIFYLLSIGLCAQALRHPRLYVVKTLGALIFLAIGLFPTEYFIGLEPLRGLFIWVIVAETTGGFRARLVKAFRAWWPYLGIWLLDLIWLVYYYDSGAYVSYDVTTTQSTAPLGHSLLIFGDALWKAGLYSWFQVLPLTIRSISAPTSLSSLLLIFVTFILASFYLQRLQFPLTTPMANARSATDAGQAAPYPFAVPAMLIGLMGILLGRVPSFAAALPLTLQSSFDRFMISMMLGGCLFLTGLVEFLIQHQQARILAFASVIALGVGQQFFNANIFRRDWQGQQQIYWQLAWRIPALRPGTAVITQQMPLDYETDLSMTAALNWIYAPRIEPPNLPYALLYTEKRLGGGVLAKLDLDTDIVLRYRTVTFTGNTSQVLGIYVPHSGCLHVFDPSLDDAEIYTSFPDSVTALIPLSNPSLIISDASPLQLPSPPFQSEPPHTWCYFYEKAELARQVGDWESIVRLGDEAVQKGLASQDAFEWLPFIEARARTGNLDSAEQDTRIAWDGSPKIHRGLCLLWMRIQADGPDEAQALAARLIGSFECGH